MAVLGLVAPVHFQDDGRGHTATQKENAGKSGPPGKLQQRNLDHDQWSRPEYRLSKPTRRQSIQSTDCQIASERC
jgi:hypothetical protein